jgi:V/A-type H+/Na+-transporting ATPase subunit D
MALLSVNANRMNLLNLRKRQVIARKGHKLLKDKQDMLMRDFKEIIEEIRGMRANTEQILIEALRKFTLATGGMTKEEIEGTFVVPASRAEVQIKTQRVLNLRVPKFEVQFSGEGISYSLYNTSSELDIATENMAEALKLLIKLAETEKKLEMLAQEIDTTRRRVNALEYVLIPDIRDTIKYIQMKLEELDRGNLSRLMKVKKIIAAKYEQA